jgi:hypothetical protein
LLPIIVADRWRPPPGNSPAAAFLFHEGDEGIERNGLIVLDRYNIDTSFRSNGNRNMMVEN